MHISFLLISSNKGAVVVEYWISGGVMCNGNMLSYKGMMQVIWA